MNSQDLLIRLLYRKLSNNGFNPTDFVIEFKKDSCTVSTINHSHTALIKIQIKNFETDQTGAYIIKIKDMIKSNYVAYKIESDNDVAYFNSLTRFDDLLFKKEDYVSCPYYELEKYLSVDLRKICFDSLGEKSLYDIYWVQSVIDKDNTGLQLYIAGDSTHSNGPLVINYKWGLLDLDCYAMVAPLIDEPLEKADIICRLPF